MNKQFDVVQLEQPNRNGFDLSHTTTTSINMGTLVPVSVMEVIPGDKFTIGAECLVRFAPLVAPVMHRFDARIEYFFVPNRLTWDQWNQFISTQPGAVGLPAVPTVNISQGAYNSHPLADYMGIPQPSATGTIQVNALPFAAYQKIYDEYYRDQNLITQQPSGFTLVNGDNTANITQILSTKNRCWEHDIFTSSLPFAQKGNPVTIGTASFQDVNVLIDLPNPPGGTTTWAGTSDLSGATSVNVSEQTPGIGGTGFLFADTSALDAFSLTVNDLREAVALQKWLEINARAGTRINEVIEGHFNVKPDDARIQRPEYIVGVKTPISISEVLNTTGTIDAPQGNMAGHGIAAISDDNFGSYFAKEHGYIIGILSVMPKTAYQQGLAKHWLKFTDTTQYFWPTMANIGEQPVDVREVYTDGDAPITPTFGYMPAYYDYRSINNRITGEFKNSLSYWTCSRIFTSEPALNASFVIADPRTDIFAVTGTNNSNLYVQVLNKVYASRLIPQYGTPGLPTL